MNAYTVIRRVHLFAAQVLLGFVLMYFVSGFVMLHRSWFPPSPPPQVREVPLPPPPDDRPRALARHLQQTFGWQGRPGNPVRLPDGSLRVNFAQPRIAIDAVVAPDRTSVRITERRYGMAETLSRMHHLRGFQGGWAYAAWALLYDLASVALVVFAATGIYLWFRSTRRHLGGWLCLAAGTGLSVAMVLFLMLR